MEQSTGPATWVKDVTDRDFQREVLTFTYKLVGRPIGLPKAA